MLPRLMRFADLLVGAREEGTALLRRALQRMPQTQISSEKKTGFRVSVGGLACADKITVTLKFNDGQSQQVALDGCKLAG